MDSGGVAASSSPRPATAATTTCGTCSAEALIPPGEVRHSVWREQTSPKGRIPAGITLAERMRRRLATKTGKQRPYLQRQASIEPVFGTTRAARGLQQFQLRGLVKSYHVWRFDMAVHNRKKIISRLRAAIAPPTLPGTQRRTTNNNPTPAQSRA